MKEKFKTSYKVIIKFTILLFFTILFSVYFYGISETMLPGEEGVSVLAEYFKRSFGDNNGGNSENMIWSIARYLGYCFGGLDLSACYFMLSFCYFLILLITGYLCLSDGECPNGKWNWWLFPVFIYLMVLINTGSPEFGLSEKHFNAYPFFYHMPAIFYALVTTIFIRQWLHNIHSRKHLILCVTAVAVSLCAGADLIYLILAVVPLCLVLFFQCLMDRKKNSIVLIGGGLLLLLLVALKYTGYLTDLFSYWFSDIPVSYGEWTSNENVLYGESNFGDMNSITDRMENYCKGLLGIFNADLSHKPILRVNTLFTFFRIIVVLILIAAMIRSIVHFLSGKKEDTYSVFLAIGFAVLSLFFILFEFGHLVVNYRYLSALLPWGTLFLCHKLTKYGSGVKLRFVNCPLVKHSFVPVIFLFFSILCLFDFQFVFNKKQYTETDQSNIMMSDYLSGQELLYGFSPYWLSYSLTLPNAGDSILFSASVNSNATGLESDFFGLSADENYHHEYCNYIVVGDGTVYDHLYEGKGMDWITAQYGTPVNTKQLYGEIVLIYDYNIGIVPRVYEAQAVQWYSYGTSSEQVTITPQKPLFCSVSDLPLGIWEIRLYGSNVQKLTARLGTLDALYVRAEKDYTAFGFEISETKDYDIFISQATGHSVLDKFMIVNISDGIDLYDCPMAIGKGCDPCTLNLDDFTGVCDIIAYSSDSRELSLYIDDKIMTPVACGDERCVWRVNVNEISDPDACYITADQDFVYHINCITICSPHTDEYSDAANIYWMNNDLYTLSDLMRYDRDFSMVPGQTVFGPYITLEPGNYQLYWDAKTFSDPSVMFTITSDLGANTIPVSSYSVSDDSIIMEFEITEPTQNIEFVCINNSEKMILISHVNVIHKK